MDASFLPPPPLYSATASEPSDEAQPFEGSQSFHTSTARGGFVDRRGTSPSTFLHHAAETGNLDQIQVILSTLGWDERNLLLKKVLYGELALHCAARGGHLDVLELLLPPDVPELSNAQCENGGWSALHFAAGYGHAGIVQWLLISRMADTDLQDKEGNTPAHLAVSLGRKDVVRYLVQIAGADISILNRQKMMPVSFCSDEAMFHTLLPAYLPGSASLARAGRDRWGIYSASDDDGRSVLQYAAQFSRDTDALAVLLMQFGPDYLDENRDSTGDSFLHVAARFGNMHILQALERLGSIRPDVSKLISTSGSYLDHSPALYALLHEHRDFFDKITIMDKDLRVTLRCIISALTDELQYDILIKDRLALFAGTLPTYLALYANKYCIFDFLLEVKLISLTQWDSEHHRTCLHWAVLDRRADIIEKLCENRQVRPAILDGDGKSALQHAFEQNNQMAMDIMRARADFKEYEEKLYRDRDVYVQALNAILVGAALIASVAFAGYLQWPSTADFKYLDMKIFWASNSISFFTSVATMCVTTSALIPSPHRYVGDIVNRLQFAISVDAGLLALSIAAATCSFAAVGFAAIESSTFAYHAIMRATTAAAGCLAIVMWLGFVVHICRLQTAIPGIGFLRQALGRWPAGFAKSSQKAYSTSNPGYRSLTKTDLEALMDGDLASIVNFKEDGLINVTKRQAAASHVMAKFLHKQVSHENALPGPCYSPPPPYLPDTEINAQST